MALGKCRECGAKVSSEAPACPRCGIGQPVVVSPATKKRIHAWHIAAAIFALPFIAAAIGTTVTSTSRPENPAVAAKMDAEKAAAEHTSALRGRLAVRCIAAIKRSLQDPDSADFDAAYGGQIGYRVGRDGAKLLQFEFRAKNGFNAVRTATATCKFNMKNSDGGDLTFDIS